MSPRQTTPQEVFVRGVWRENPVLVQLLGLSGFEARIVFGEEPVPSGDRKALAVRLHEAVASCFRPMLMEREACLTSRTYPVSS